MRNIFYYFLFVLFVIGCKAELNTKDNPYRFLEERKYLKLEKRNSVPINYRCTKMELLSNGDAVLLDKYEQQFVVYDELLQEKYRWGKKGVGPDELRNVGAFCFSMDTCYVYDKDSKAVKKFSLPKFEPIFYKKIPEQISRSNFNKKDPNRLLIKEFASDFKMKFSWLQIDSSKNIKVPVDGLNNILPNRAGISISHDGFFASNDCGQQFFACYLNNNIYKVGLDNKVLQKGGIYEVAAPTLSISETSAAPIESVIHLGGQIFADCEYLYLISMVPDQENQRVIDIYNVDNLSYSKSYSIPYLDEEKKKTTDVITVNNELLYVVYEDALVVYEME